MNMTVELEDKELLDFVKTRNHPDLKALVEKDKPQGNVVIVLRMTATMLEKLLGYMWANGDAERAEKDGVSREHFETKKMRCTKCRRDFDTNSKVGSRFVETMDGGLVSTHEEATCVSVETQ